MLTRSISQTPLLVVLCTGLSACSFNLVQAEVDVSELCFTGIESDIPAAVVDDFSYIDSQTFDDPLGDIGNDVTVEAYLTGVTLVATEGVDSLSFVQSLQVSLSDTAATPVLPEIQLLNFEQQAGDPDVGIILEPTTNADADIAAYLTLDQMEMTFEISGSLPENSWRAELELCFQTHLEYVIGL